MSSHQLRLSQTKAFDSGGFNAFLRKQVCFLPYDAELFPGLNDRSEIPICSLVVVSAQYNIPPVIDTALLPPVALLLQ